jgi:hypothetical protein
MSEATEDQDQDQAEDNEIVERLRSMYNRF